MITVLLSFLPRNRVLEEFFYFKNPNNNKTGKKAVFFQNPEVI